MAAATKNEEIDFGAQRLFKKGRSVKTSGQTRTRQHEKNKTAGRQATFTSNKLWPLLWLSCLKQEGQTEEEGALQKTCLLILVNMSTVSKSSNKAQQHIPTCCLQLLGPLAPWLVHSVVAPWLVCPMPQFRGCSCYSHPDAQDQTSRGNIHLSEGVGGLSPNFGEY